MLYTIKEICMGFIDDMGKTLNEGFNKVSDGISKIQNRGQEMMQSVGLNSRLTSLEAKKSVALTNIGKLIYDRYERGDEVGEDVLRRKVQEVVEIEREIDIVKAELNTIKAQHDPDICASEKSEHVAGYSRTPGFECPHCHEPANQEKIYCAFCGGSLSSAAEPKSKDKEAKESKSAEESDGEDSHN